MTNTEETHTAFNTQNISMDSRYQHACPNRIDCMQSFDTYRMHRRAIVGIFRAVRDSNRCDRETERCIAIRVEFGEQTKTK